MDKHPVFTIRAAHFTPEIEWTATTTNEVLAYDIAQALITRGTFEQIELEDDKHTVVWASYPPEAADHSEATWAEVVDRRNRNAHDVAGERMGGL